MPNLSRAIDRQPAPAAPARSRGLVLLAGVGEAAAEALRAAAQGEYEVATTLSPDATWDLLASGQVAVLVLGEGFAGEAARDFLDRAVERLPELAGNAVNLEIGRAHV